MYPGEGMGFVSTMADGSIERHAMMSSQALLSLQGVRKSYPSVVAVDDVSLSVVPGEIHAVLGENGAGKSTLMKIIYGAVKPDSGRIVWIGEPVDIGSKVFCSPII